MQNEVCNCRHEGIYRWGCGAACRPRMLMWTVRGVSTARLGRTCQQQGRRVHVRAGPPDRVRLNVQTGEGGNVAGAALIGSKQLGLGLTKASDCCGALESSQTQQHGCVLSRGGWWHPTNDGLPRAV